MERLLLRSLNTKRNSIQTYIIEPKKGDFYLKEYEVAIERVVRTVILIDANSEDEAIKIAKEKYNEGVHDDEMMLEYEQEPEFEVLNPD